MNRRFKQIQVWNHSVELYFLTCKLLSKSPYKLKKTVSNKLKRTNGESRLNLYPSISLFRQRRAFGTIFQLCLSTITKKEHNYHQKRWISNSK